MENLLGAKVQGSQERRQKSGRLRLQARMDQILEETHRRSDERRAFKAQARHFEDRREHRFLISQEISNAFKVKVKINLTSAETTTFKIPKTSPLTFPVSAEIQT